MNSLGQPPKPINFKPPEQPRQPKREINTKLLLIIGGAVIGLLLLVTLIVLIVSAVNKDPKTPESPTTTNQNEPDDDADTDGDCGAKQRRYQNADLSLGFCYPNNWGDVKLQDAAFDPSDDGTRWKLSFSKKPQVHIGLVSDDWSTDTSRKSTCADPAVQELPSFESFSARWQTEASKPSGDKKIKEPIITSASRGLEISTDEYIINEHVDDSSTKGVCITGFNLTNGVVFRHVEASYYSAFTATTATAQAHINAPTKLVPVVDRTDFLALVKSMYAL